MTTREVAAYLRLAPATVYKLAQAGKIPAVKVGGQWRFSRQSLEERRTQAKQRNLSER